MEKLTKNQKIVYDTLKNIIKSKQESPTLKTLKEQMVDKLHVCSLNSIVQYLESLERKGYIFKERNKRGGISLRNIEENHTSFGFYEIPIVGLANCGIPTAYAEQQWEGMVKVSKKLLPIKSKKGVFMVRVNGDSMNKRGLNEGDYAIIKHRDFCGNINNGDIVLAVVNGLATIKTFFQTIDAVVLRPESTSRKHQPIFLHPDDNFFINGRLVGVFKYR